MRSHLALLALVACTGPDTDCDCADPDTDGDPGVSLSAAEVDECGTLCLTVTGPPGADVAVESDRDGFLNPPGQRIGPAGAAEVCVDGPFSPGSHALAIHIGDVILSEEIGVHPFGWAFGLDRPTSPLDALPWVPEVEGLGDAPVFTPAPGAWDSYSVMMPSTIVRDGERLLYYAGTEDIDFRVGIASRADDAAPFTRLFDDPVLTAAATGAVDGDWNFFAQNTPHALAVGDEVWLYYNGRASGTGTRLSIGVARSADGRTFEDVPDNPVLAPSGVAGAFDESAVAHPSVLVRDGVFELWFAGGGLEIGYALSSDGVHFERYCDNPVFSGSPGSWDRGEVKAPEVVWDGERYWMAYSGCGRGCYEVGWAASDDGVRWVAADAPILARTTPPAWNSFGIQSSYVEVDGDSWRFWYAGTGLDSGAIGVASARR